MTLGITNIAGVILKLVGTTVEKLMNVAGQILLDVKDRRAGKIREAVQGVTPII
jgi:hypothetical protein